MRTKSRTRSIVIWTLVALVGAVAWGVIALVRGEQISAVWLIAAAVGSYAIAYRFYARFIAKKVLGVDDKRATPAERLDNDMDFQPTDRRVLFGHHFAAIAGAGPLVGPVLAAQMGYLPGTIWIIVGVIFAGAVQDMVILFFSMRRDGKSLGQMARDEIGPVGGVAALVAVFSIMIILLAVLALVVVNALAESPWGTFSIAMTIPIAFFMGFYLRVLRPGRVMETTAIGVGAAAAGDRRRRLGAGLVAGRHVHAVARDAGLLPGRLRLLRLGAAGVDAAGAARLPVDLHEDRHHRAARGRRPRDAAGDAERGGHRRSPPTARARSSPGALFPFVFITIACGALSGFHSLIASGTTPKMIEKESQVRFIGYGAMLMESFVAVMALIAASILDPGLYYAMNAPAGGGRRHASSRRRRRSTSSASRSRPGELQSAADRGRGGDAGRAHRRRADAGRRHVGDLRRRRSAAQR